MATAVKAKPSRRRPAPRAASPSEAHLPPDWTDPDPICVDFETQSAADLQAVGGRAYCRHPSTRLLSAVFAVGGHYHVWLPVGDLPPTSELWHPEFGPRAPLTVHRGKTVPKPVLAAVKKGGQLLAHNAYGFDRFVWSEVLGQEPVRWLDTAPLARAGGLPAGLDQLSRQIGVGNKLDTGGIVKKLTRAVYSPEAGGFLYPDSKPGDLEVLLRYNVGDVVMMRKVWEFFADFEWGPHEEPFNTLCRINDRGVAADPLLLDRLAEASAESSAQAGAELRRLTKKPDGTSWLHSSNFRSTQQTHAWLDSMGLRIYTLDAHGNKKSTLRKDVLEQFLANPWMMVDSDIPDVTVGASKDIHPNVFTALRVRSAAVRITGGKVAKAFSRIAPDGRIHDLEIYHGAHTGRRTSTGVQVHNLPRGKEGLDLYELCLAHSKKSGTRGAWPDSPKRAVAWIRNKIKTAIRNCDNEDVAKQLKRLVVDDVLSALIRPCLIASPKHVLLVCDYAAVEARGVAWLAGQEDVLELYRSGGDPYIRMASIVFGREVNPKKKEKEGDLAGAAFDKVLRQIGKIIVLGCGYGMGIEKFRIFAGLAGADLQGAGTSAEACITAFRQAHPKIAGLPAGVIDGRPYFRGGLWDKIENAAKAAVANRPASQRVLNDKLSFEKHGSDLHMVLPSGRHLIYRNCRIEDRVPAYCYLLGLEPRPKPTLVFQSPRGVQTTYGGKLTENAVQGLCYDAMADAEVKLDHEGFCPVVDVHDEIVCERPHKSDAQVERDLRHMAEVMRGGPDWAVGFPIGVEGHAVHRYFKGKVPVVAKVALGV